MASWDRTRPLSALSAARKCTFTGGRITMLHHLFFGFRLSVVNFEKRWYHCSCRGHMDMESVPLKANGHNITRELLRFARDLLAYGFVNKEVSELTGLGKNTARQTHE